MIKKETRDKIVAQALNEITFARNYKQGKISNWQKNENLYYGRKQKADDSRANVDLGKMQEFVHTLLSKIDNPLTFKFTKRKDAQLKRVQRLNSLRVADQQTDNWDIKDLVGKKQAVVYGRAVYSYSADSYNGYCAHLDPVDVYDYLIDPSAGGIEIEKARNMGRYGVVKDKSELRAGVKEGLYLKYETSRLIENNGNASDKTQEEINKNNRAFGQGVSQSDKEDANPDKYKFWEWYTTFEGERYYLLLQEKSGAAIRVEPLTEIFESGLWPFWTWAAFPDLTEFWTPSYCDYVREIFMAQSVTINQALDNAEQINKPTKAVDVGAIKNLSELKYKRGGNTIKVNAGMDVNKAVQYLTVPSIDTPFKVYDRLEAIHEKASGVTSASKGVSDEDKVGIYEGNQAESADRFGLLNKSYSYGYKRFALLYEHGVREHLVKKTAVDILGPEGVSTEQVSRRDIFHKGDSFGVMVEASNAEIALSAAEKRTKIAFLSANAMNPSQNPKKAYEIGAGIAGFDDETIRQLQDTSEFGSAAIMSEAERDIEALLEGNDIRPNPIANTAYKQRFVDYIQNHQEDISLEQFNRLSLYIRALDPVIMQNMARQIKEQTLKMTMEAMKVAPGAASGVAPRTAAPEATTAIAPEGELPVNSL